MYDFLIVGSGIFGAVFAHQATLAGKTCLVIEKRPHAGGNVYCETIDGIITHKYGPHIFHTSSADIWNYVTSLTPFRKFVHKPIAYANGRYYSLPFNMTTFSELWAITDPDEARAKIASQAFTGTPSNLEEQALKMVGRDLYEMLVKGYTEKQWGRPCTQLPASIIRRIPVRFTFDNSYFDDPYQGIPFYGYNALIAELFRKVEVRLDTDYCADPDHFRHQARHVIYTGPIDEFYNYRFGPLQYRSLEFAVFTSTGTWVQPAAVVNYPGLDVKYTRVIEHKHFHPIESSRTVYTKEFPVEWTPGRERYYPINDAANKRLYGQYRAIADQEPDVTFGGRLGSYKYYDMDQVVGQALKTARTLLK